MYRVGKINALVWKYVFLRQLKSVLYKKLCDFLYLERAHYTRYIINDCSTCCHGLVLRFIHSSKFLLIIFVAGLCLEPGITFLYKMKKYVWGQIKNWGNSPEFSTHSQKKSRKLFPNTQKIRKFIFFIFFQVVFFT